MWKSAITCSILVMLALIFGAAGCSSNGGNEQPTATASPIPASVLQSDMSRVQFAVFEYVTASSATGTPRYPTSSGNLPALGQYALINFNAGFQDTTGKTMRFYPDFLEDLPRHWNSGVWRIDSEADVSVDIEPDIY